MKTLPESDTPRTDEFEAQLYKPIHHPDAVRAIKFARTLERELNESKKRQNELEGYVIIAQVAESKAIKGW